METKGEQNPTRDDRLADVLESYLASAEAGESISRTALLEQNPDLADDLAACLDTLDFIGHSVGHGPATSVLECGQQFGEYQILREIGRGGMGVVYEAFHLGLERRVALKVLSGRSFEDEVYRDRFLQEAKTAARLHHTNIVPIFEVGELDGVCYYAMQFIAGQSLGMIVRELRATGRSKPKHDLTLFPPGTIVRDERPVPDAVAPVGSAHIGPPAVTSERPPDVTSGWSPLAGGPSDDAYFREVARIIAQAALALAHAHEHDVVHRDIKPSNLILDREGRVWVTDFGLALRGDAPPKRESGEAVGTPAYMSPEQVRPGSNVDHRTDIYSLGATLYELLTLRPLFEGDSSLAILTRIASVEPPDARSHNPLIPRDLDTIVREAIAKRPESRYRGAAEMADDLQRYLEHRPIRARRVGPLERLLLWRRREPKLAGVTMAAATLLVLVSIISHWAILRAKGRAVEARRVAEDRQFRASAAEAVAQAKRWDALFQQARATRLSFQSGRRWTALDLIAEARTIPSNRVQHSEPLLALRDEAIAALSIDDARLHTRLAVDDAIGFLAFSATGKGIVCGTMNGTLLLFDLQTGSAPLTLVEGNREDQPMLYSPSPTAFSPCGRFLATAARDGSIGLWDIAARKLLATFDSNSTRQRPPAALVFLAEPVRLVAVENDGSCRQWELHGEAVRALPGPELPRVYLATRGPDDRSVTLLTINGELKIWDSVSGAQRDFADALTIKSRTSSLAWNSAGKMLALGRASGGVDLFVPGESHVVQALGSHRGWVRAIAFNPSGTVLAAGGMRDAALKLWDVRTGDLIATLNEPQAGIVSASFSPDGRFVAAGGYDGTIWVWELVSPRAIRQLPGHVAVVTRVAITPDGTRLVSGAEDGSVLVWDLQSDTEPETLVAKPQGPQSGFNDPACTGLSISSDGRLVAVRSRGGLTSVWDLESKTMVASRPAGRVWNRDIGFVPGTHELVRTVESEIRRSRVDDATPRTVATTRFQIRAAAISGDGRWVAASTWGSRIEVFDLETGAAACEPIEVKGEVRELALSPDGKLLAAGESRGGVRLIELPSRTLRAEWQESDDAISALSFSPNGVWLAVAVRDGTIRLRSGADGAAVARLPSHEGGVQSLAFGPRSQTLATCGEDKLVNVWRLDALHRELVELGLEW